MIKRKFSLFAMVLVMLLLTGCGDKNTEPSVSTADDPAQIISAPDISRGEGSDEETEDDEMGTKRVASDGAQMQTADKMMPTRVIENGTRINMHFGDTVIPGILNDCETAQALIEKLPYTVHVSRYSHDFCGRMEELPYNEDEVHYGWLNGDIDYAIDAPWFTILFEDEENSEQYDYQVNIGVITCPLSEIKELEGSYDVLIELAE